MSTFTRNIDPADIVPGDHFEAWVNYRKTARIMGARQRIRRCTLDSMHGDILRVRVSGMRGLVPIYRSDIVNNAWGYRP